MPLRRRLALGLAAIALVLVAPLVLALTALERQADAASSLRDRDFSASLLLGRIRGTTDDLRRAETALLFVPGPPSRDTMSALIDRLHAMADTLSHFELDSAARNVQVAVSEVARAAPREFAAALDGRLAQAESISTNEIVPAVSRVERWLSAAERSLRERTRDRIDAAAAESATAQRLSLIGLLAAAVIAAAISLWLARSISRPVSDLERGMRQVADGNLKHRIEMRSERSDEFARLGVGFNSMVEQLGELDKLRAEFISIASHELKTPINVISGYASLLQEGVYGEMPGSQRKIVSAIDAQAKTLARLVKQLLDISRFRAGVGKLDPRPLALDGFLTRLETAFEGLALQRGIAWQVERGAGLPAEVTWDEDRMNEVLGNLVSNAFKFTERGGRVTLRAEPTDGSVALEVVDTGAGIPSEQLPRIFEKFYQAANQEKASGEGTGLGLAIVKEIVDAHGGTIAVDSAPGVGTTFTVMMPVAASRRRTSTPESIPA